jgi:hypothetical protein
MVIHVFKFKLKNFTIDTNEKLVCFKNMIYFSVCATYISGPLWSVPAGLALVVQHRRVLLSSRPTTPRAQPRLDASRARLLTHLPQQTAGDIERMQRVQNMCVRFVCGFRNL